VVSATSRGLLHGAAPERAEIIGDGSGIVPRANEVLDERPARGSVERHVGRCRLRHEALVCR
jgi:hypothetical protein